MVQPSRVMEGELLTLGDRFYGAWLGALVAGGSGGEAPGADAIGSAKLRRIALSAMLRRYEPFGAPVLPQVLGRAGDRELSDRELSDPDAWIERVLHQQLSRAGHKTNPNTNPVDAQAGLIASELAPVWKILCQDLPWETSFKLLGSTPARSRSVLGLWLGAAQGHWGIPLQRRSPEWVVLARGRSRQDFRAWAGCHEWEPLAPALVAPEPAPEPVESEADDVS